MCSSDLPTPTPTPATATSIAIPCPPPLVGRVIGRGGETIRALQQASLAHISLDQAFPPGVPRLVLVRGPPDAVARAAAMVSELIAGVGPDGVTPSSTQTVLAAHSAGTASVVPCPPGMVGRLIGRGGETVKALQRAFGVNIQIDQGSGSGGGGGGGGGGGAEGAEIGRAHV